MSYIDPDRLENALAFIEQQQYEASAQQSLQAEFEAAAARHDDVDPENLAGWAPHFNGDFDAAANHIREQWAVENPPRTIGEAVDRLVGH